MNDYHHGSDKEVAPSVFDDRKIFAFFEIDLQFRWRCYGGMPKSKKILDTWIGAKGENPREPLEEKLKVVVPEEPLDLEEQTELVSCGFRRDDSGIFLRDFMVESNLELAATTAGITKKRGARAKINHALFISPERIRFFDKTEPDGVEDIAGHVMTPRGKRSILKRVEYVDKGRVSFRIRLYLHQPLIGEKELGTMLHLGQDNGLGSCRSIGGGKYNVTRFEDVTKKIAA